MLSASDQVTFGSVVALLVGVARAGVLPARRYALLIDAFVYF